MDLKYLNTFRTIVEEGSFSKAASRLNYTQSTITFQINQLEQDLSTRLFEKIGRRMVLTKAGEQLIPYVDNVLDSVSKMHNFERDLAECRGDLHIGVGETLLCFQLPAVLKKFHRLAPHARLFIRSMNCYDIRDELLDGSLDLGVFYENVGGFGSNLQTHLIGEFETVLAASPLTKELYPDFVTPDRQIPLPFIINEPNCIFRQIYEEYLRKNSILMDHTIELWSIPTIKNLVKSDVGVTYLPRFAVKDELESGDLVEIETAIEHPYISAVCAHHKNKWVSPLMQQFIDLCEEHGTNLAKPLNAGSCK